MVVYLVMTIALIWGLAYLKMSWSNVEVDIYLDDGDYFFVDEDGRSYDPLKVHLDTRYFTIRTAAHWTWALCSILTAIIILIKINKEIEV